MLNMQGQVRRKCGTFKLLTKGHLRGWGGSSDADAVARI